MLYFDSRNPIHWLDSKKIYISQIETQIVDGCNLNCKACCHFSNLFKTNEIYPLENFTRDVCRISQVCDVATFFLLGGEPLLMKNLDEYIKISRQYFPTSYLGILTNGLLIPALPQKILDAMRASRLVVHISGYPPTMKIADKIKAALEPNQIPYIFRDAVDDKKFRSFMTLHTGNDPEKARAVCGNDGCRFLRNGKIYKCPVDALSYRFAETFGIENYPKATGVDIYAQNFSSLLPMLDDNIELCNWCSEQVRLISWEVSRNPELEDWLADPQELQNFM